MNNSNLTLILFGVSFFSSNLLFNLDNLFCLFSRCSLALNLGSFLFLVPHFDFNHSLVLSLKLSPLLSGCTCQSLTQRSWDISLLLLDLKYLASRPNLIPLFKVSGEELLAEVMLEINVVEPLVRSLDLGYQVMG